MGAHLDNELKDTRKMTLKYSTKYYHLKYETFTMIEISNRNNCSYIDNIINGRSFEGLTTQISTLLSFFYLCLIKTINHTRPPFIYFSSKCFFCSYFFICYYFIISLLISSLLYLSYSQVISKQKILAVVDLVLT